MAADGRDRWFACGIHTMNGKDVLGEIDSDGDNGGHGLAPSTKTSELMKSSTFPSWHSVAVHRKPIGAQFARDGEVPFIRWAFQRAHMDEELQNYMEKVRQEHEERMFFLKHHLGAEVHWFFSQGSKALKQGLILPACSSFIIGIEASLRVTMAQIEKPAPVQELDPMQILSNRLLVSARAAGLPVEYLAFPEEHNFIQKLESIKPNLRNVEIVRVRHNLCHGNILEYINKDLGEDNHFFTPECCLKLATQLILVSKAWVEALGKFRRSMKNA